MQVGGWDPGSLEAAVAHNACLMKIGGMDNEWVQGRGRSGVEAFLPRRSSSWAQTVRIQISLLTTYTRRRLRMGPEMVSAPAGGPRQAGIRALEPWALGLGLTMLGSPSGFAVLPQTPTLAGWNRPRPHPDSQSLFALTCRSRPH